MKTLLTLIVTCLVSIASAQDLTIPLSGKGGKGEIPTGLKVIAAAQGDSVVITLTDGKQKFGAHDIVFQKGDIRYTRPRLKIKVAMDKVNTATSSKPYELIDFTHKGAPYKIIFLKNGGTPNLVIKKL